ncbi:MAG: FAD-dependent oxidoreductase [Anaerolineae bacterium]
MRDVVIVGGGLTGLVTAYELSQHAVDVTLIEVKRRLGGSIDTRTQADCVLDGVAFAVHDTLDAEWLEGLGLADETFALETGGIAFKRGTTSLIDALQARITATRLMRMAVSSVGELDEKQRFSICMENGLMFDARALILAVPARYAERMFYGYITPITEQLLDYHYDTVYRVSLVCASHALPTELVTPPDMGYVFIHRTEHPSRVPAGYTLLQFGIRLHTTPTTEALIAFVREQFGLPAPLTTHVSHWAEADPISCYDDHHRARVATIREQLPTGIALVGSDYALNMPAMPAGVVSLNERIEQGKRAAHEALASL